MIKNIMEEGKLDRHQLCATLYKRAEELKIKLSNSGRSKSLVADSGVLDDLHELTSVYQRLLLTDLDYALDKKVEVDLWNCGFKDHISRLQSDCQNRSKEKAKRQEAQVNLTWFLDFASGFYVALLQQLCSNYNLDLPFLRSGKHYGMITENSNTCLQNGTTSSGLVNNCNYICCHCLVHVGDLARYRGQLKQAETFYRHALTVAPSSGHAYNQIALLQSAAAAAGNNLSCVFYYVRSVALKYPFPAGAANLSKMFNKVSSSESDSFVDKFLKFHALLHEARGLKSAAKLNADLNESLTVLVATEGLTTQQLIQCSAITLFQLSRCDETVVGQTEKAIRYLLVDHLAATINALLLPVYTVKQGQQLIGYSALPSLKLLLDWITLNPKCLDEAGFLKRRQIWPGLCKALNQLSAYKPLLSDEKCDDYPLPEDWDLQAFQPLNILLSKYNFKQILKAGGATLEQEKLNYLRASRLVALGHMLPVLTYDKDKQYFEATTEQSAVYVPEEPHFSSDEEVEEEEEVTGLEASLAKAVTIAEPKNKKRHNVAMEAIMRQAATTSPPTAKQVTFKTPSPCSTASSTQEDSQAVSFSQEDPTFQHQSVWPPPQRPQRPALLPTPSPRPDFSVPPPPLNPHLGNQAQLLQMLSMPRPPPISHGPFHPAPPNAAAAAAATFRGPAYSLFAGSNPSWSLGPSNQQRPQQQQHHHHNQHHQLFQPGPSPLERLLQQNKQPPHNPK